MILLVPALVVVLFSGCRRPEVPSQRQGWVRCAALLPLHPNQAMLTDLDQRLDALAGQRRVLLEHPSLPLPPEGIPLDTPAFAALPAPDPATPADWPTTPTQPQLDALHERLNEEMAHEDAKLQLQLDNERAAAYQEKERALLQRADTRREEVARTYRLDIPTAKIRWTMAVKEAERAEADAAMARLLVTQAREQADTAAARSAKNPRDSKLLKAKQAADIRLRQTELRMQKQEDHAKSQRAAEQQIAQQLASDQQALQQAQGKIQQDLENELKALQQQLFAQMHARLTDWRTQQQQQIERQLTERAATLEAENAPPAPAPTATLRFPELRTRPLDSPTDRMHIAVNESDFHAFRTRLGAVRAIDDVVSKLTLQRLALKKAMTQDTRQAAMSVAEQHGWTVQFDTASGKDVTGDVHGWLAEYWPPPPHPPTPSPR